ncbi:MAG: hypothetical protein C0602_00425 [Denitrovibrio sp.]|nr:MAG: hypothetical protein C0602_00425 [Denitrovibrio sp.]
MFRKILRSRQNKFLFLLLLSIAVLLLVSSIIFYLMEGEKLVSLFDALWWTVVTITTVGYGDIVPYTAGGKVFGLMVIVSGFIMMSVTTALVSSILISRKLKEERGLSNVTYKQHTIICGWNKTTESVISELFKCDEALYLVLINNLAEEDISEVIFNHKGRNIQFVRGDFLSEHILDRANVAKAKDIILTPDSDTGTDDKIVLAAYTIRAINQKARIFAHIKSNESVQHLKKANVNDYVISDSNVSFMLGRMVTAPGITQTVRMIFDNEDGHGFGREKVPAELVGKTFIDAIMHFRKKGKIALGIMRDIESFSLKNVLSADDSFLDEFIAMKFEKAGKTVGQSNKREIKLNPSDETVIEEGTYILVME